MALFGKGKFNFKQVGFEAWLAYSNGNVEVMGMAGSKHIHVIT